MSVTFSIAIPALKPEYLSRAVSSVLAQNHEDYELLLGDVAGNTEVQRTAKQLAHPRLRYFRGDRRSKTCFPTDDWLWLAQKAEGRFLILLGDDDLLARNFLATMQELIEARPEGILYRARLKIIGPQDEPLQIGPVLPELETWDEYMYFRNQYHRPQSTAEFCVRKERLLERGGYARIPLALGSDDLTWINLALEQPVISTNRTHACWRNHSSNLSGTLEHLELRIQACETCLANELKIVEDHQPQVIPRHLLQDSARKFWQGHISYLGCQDPSLKRRIFKWLLSVTVPSYFEQKLTIFYHQKLARKQMTVER